MLIIDFPSDDMLVILGSGAILPYLAVATMDWVRGKVWH